MKTVLPLSRALILNVLIAVSLVTTTLAQEISVPDPGLNAAIRQTLQKPTGPLTAQDMLTLTNLVASGRKISSVAGLEAAGHLVSLNLEINRLTNFSVASTLTNLMVLGLKSNSLTSCFFPGGPTKLSSLDLSHNLFGSFSLPSNVSGLSFLDLGFNGLTNVSLPNGLTNLTGLVIRGNTQLADLTVPQGLTALATLDIDNNELSHVSLPTGMRSLLRLSLQGNQLFSLLLPAGMTNLGSIFLQQNHLDSLSLPADLRKLTFVELTGNQLTNLTLPGSLTALIELHLPINRLASFTLPSGLTNLTTLDLFENALTSFTLPTGLVALTNLDLGINQLTTLTLPPDMQELSGFFVGGNPLATLVLSEPLAATNLAGEVASLRNQGVMVFTYPLAVSLASPRRAAAGAFQFTISGPPGVDAVMASFDLASWSQLAAVTNQLGSIGFTDVTASQSPQKFYRARVQGPPTNMVFIPPNTFTMGSPANEQDRSINEGPQTIVTLSRGFWIGKYEVTQAEYLSVMNTNPSPFPGDLSRPVSSVSWLDATNYCAKLTQREVAAGQISAGSHYRLPTEAEWECAARAGTSTRFSYGDDPGYTALADHAWYASNSGITAHPIGQKLPNPWGLYDMEGNVVEWCQDWFGSLPGGVQTDPTGPASSASGRKVVRGGAFDNTEQSSRSASRLLFSAFPPLTDTDLGFRVVLVTGPL